MTHHTSTLTRDDGTSVVVEARFVPTWKEGQLVDRLDVCMPQHQDLSLREWGSIARFAFSDGERDRLFDMWLMFRSTP